MLRKTETNAPYERTEEVCALIDSSYAQLNSGKQEQYSYTGSNNYDFRLINHFSIKSKMVLDALTADLTPGDEPIKVLDIGAGDFSFGAHISKSHPGKVLAYGIAGNDIHRKKELRIEDDYHLIANAEYLSKVFPENTFDLILSQWTFPHYQDPIGALIETYRTLKVGGTLMVDRFEMSGCHEYLPYLGLYLQQQGYEVLTYRTERSNATYERMSSFIIKKTADKPELVLPVQVDKIAHDYPVYTIFGKKLNTTRLVYKPNADFIEFYQHHKNKNEMTYNLGVQILQKKVQANKQIQQVVEQSTNLYQVFADENYQLLTPDDQNTCLLAVIANSLSYEDYSKLYDFCLSLCEEDRTAQQQIKRILQEMIDSQLTGAIATLTFDSRINMFIRNSRILSKTEKDDLEFFLIQFAGMSDLVRLGEQEEILTTLNKMQIPYASTTNYYSSPNLAFPHLAMGPLKELNYEYYVPSLSALMHMSLGFFTSFGKRASSPNPASSTTPSPKPTTS